MAIPSVIAGSSQRLEPTAITPFKRVLAKPSKLNPALAHFLFTKAVVQGKNLLNPADESFIRTAAISKGIKFSFPSLLVFLIEQVCKDLKTGRVQPVGHYERLLMRYAQQHREELAPLKMIRVARDLAHSISQGRFPQITAPKSVPVPIAPQPTPISKTQPKSLPAEPKISQRVIKPVPSQTKRSSLIKKIAGVALCSLLIGGVYFYFSRSKFNQTDSKNLADHSITQLNSPLCPQQPQCVNFSDKPTDFLKCQSPTQLIVLPYIAFCTLLYFINTVSNVWRNKRHLRLVEVHIRDIRARLGPLILKPTSTSTLNSSDPTSSCYSKIEEKTRDSSNSSSSSSSSSSASSILMPQAPSVLLPSSPVEHLETTSNNNERVTTDGTLPIRTRQTRAKSCTPPIRRQSQTRRRLSGDSTASTTASSPFIHGLVPVCTVSHVAPPPSLTRSSLDNRTLSSPAVSPTAATTAASSLPASTCNEGFEWGGQPVSSPSASRTAFALMSSSSSSSSSSLVRRTSST